MIKLTTFINKHQGYKFQYGEWDCILFIRAWLIQQEEGEDRGAHLSGIIDKFLTVTGYWEEVKDASSYKDYSDKVVKYGQGGLFHLFIRRGFKESKKPQPGDIIIAPTSALGIVDSDYKGLFLRRTQGIVSVSMPDNSLYLKCRP